MWSAAFVPKPADWPEQCEVVGSFFVEQKSDFDPAPFKDVTEWIQSGGAKPVFIGFGSMVIREPEKLEQIIKEAARKAGIRVLVQSGWSKLNVEDEGSDLCRNVGPCPHDWLLPMVGAVIHHGGAGTTAAGLKLGLPTFICPFFGDQFMWGSFVAMAGVGPKPCPINKLTADLLAEKLKELASDELQGRAQTLAEDMTNEDGVLSGRDHFIDSLQIENMLCDVSLMLGETQLARYRLIGSGLRYHGIKVSSEIAALLEGRARIDWRFLWFSACCICPACHSEEHYWYAEGFDRHAVTSYSLDGRIRSCTHGFLASIWALFGGAFYSLFQLYVVPDRWARRQGAFGCLFGIVLAGFYVAREFFLFVLLFFDRLFVGCANGICRRDLEYVVDSSMKARVHDTPLIASELEAIVANGLPPARKEELTRSLEFVVVARAIFQQARPKLPDEHRHYVVVKLPDLLKAVRKSSAKIRLGATDSDIELLCSRLSRLPGTRVSSSADSRIVRQRRMSAVAASRILQRVAEGGEEETEYRQRLQEAPREPPLSPGQNSAPAIEPGDTTVSFSVFVQALQPVFRRVCAAEGVSTSVSYQQAMAHPPGQSVYLN
jgi:hypothetical protein